MTKFAKFFNGKESKTAKEAIKKKKISIAGMISCLAVIILCFVLIAVLSITGIFTAIVVLAALTFFFFLLKLNCARKELEILKNLYCQKCGKRFPRNLITYTEINKNTQNTRNNDVINEDTYAIVKINCQCEKCNNNHEFQRDFLVTRKKCNLAGATLSVQNYSLDDRIDEYYNYLKN